MSLTVTVTPDGVFISAATAINAGGAVLSEDVFRKIRETGERAAKHGAEAGAAAAAETKASGGWRQRLERLVAALESDKRFGLTPEDRRKIFSRGEEGPALDLTGRRVFIALYRAARDQSWSVAAAARMGPDQMALIAHRDPIQTMLQLSAAGGKMCSLVLGRWDMGDEAIRYHQAGHPVVRIGHGFASLSAASKWLSCFPSVSDIIRMDGLTWTALSNAKWEYSADGQVRPAAVCDPVVFASAMALATALADQP